MRVFSMVNFDKELKRIIRQGNQKEYAKLIKKIVRFHSEEYIEDNLPTHDDFILELVNDALDELWGSHKVSRKAYYETRSPQ